MQYGVSSPSLQKLEVLQSLVLCDVWFHLLKPADKLSLAASQVAEWFQPEAMKAGEERW